MGLWVSVWGLPAARTRRESEAEMVWLPKGVNPEAAWGAAGSCGEIAHRRGITPANVARDPLPATQRADSQITRKNP